MITGFTETKSRVTKTVNAESGNYRLNATVVLESDKIVNMSGQVVNKDDAMDGMGISFDAYRQGTEIKVNYHNVASDEREVLDIISEMVDAIVAKYQLL